MHACMHAYGCVHVCMYVPYIQQRKTTGLLSIRHYFTVASVLKLTPTNMHVGRRCACIYVQMYVSVCWCV